MAHKSIQTILRVPFIGKLLLTLYRFKISSQHILPILTTQVNWLFSSNETTNFTYELSKINRQYLIAFIANITQKTYQEVENFIIEVEEDDKLKEHLQESIKISGEKYKTDLNIKYGRRIGWYAFIRILKPKIVVETGVDKGLGSCIISSALMKNKAEGHDGKYYGTDINPKAGYLYADPYNKFGEILFGDSIESLNALDESIDLFINDSDHSSEYEGAEYQVIKGKLTQNSVILSDNAHITNELLQFSLVENKEFHFFREEPKNHWHHGAGIGVALTK